MSEVKPTRKGKSSKKRKQSPTEEDEESASITKKTTSNYFETIINKENEHPTKPSNPTPTKSSSPTPTDDENDLDISHASPVIDMLEDDEAQSTKKVKTTIYDKKDVERFKLAFDNLKKILLQVHLTVDGVSASNLMKSVWPKYKFEKPQEIIDSAIKIFAWVKTTKNNDKVTKDNIVNALMFKVDDEWIRIATTVVGTSSKVKYLQEHVDLLNQILSNPEKFRSIVCYHPKLNPDPSKYYPTAFKGFFDKKLQIK